MKYRCYKTHNLFTSLFLHSYGLHSQFWHYVQKKKQLVTTWIQLQSTDDTTIRNACMYLPATSLDRFSYVEILSKDAKKYSSHTIAIPRNMYIMPTTWSRKPPEGRVKVRSIMANSKQNFQLAMLYNMNLWSTFES